MKKKLKVYQLIFIFILPILCGCPETTGISTSTDVTSQLDEILSPPSINPAEDPVPRVLNGAEPSQDENADSSANTDRSLPCLDNPTGLEAATALANSGLEISETAERGGVFKFYDKFLSQGVAKKPLEDALKYFKENQDKFENKNVISIADYSLNSKNKRFYLLDMKTGKVTKEVVAHGSGKRDGIRVGDPDHDGMLDKCLHEGPACCLMTPSSPGYNASTFNECVQTNNCRQNMTRTGFMKVKNPYPSGQNFPALDSAGNNGVRIEGLEWRNRDAGSKGVVFHERWYVRGEGSLQGRSFGCPAFPPDKGAPLLKKMKGGSLYYSYAPQCN
ncbi:MAG: hypothetical protein HN576_08020 [Bacteriovoracaceae bacterium]|nr:hypothetical protein [Bacteriovoracaceae bacterium]